MKLEISSATAQGHRSHQEDRSLALKTNGGTLLAVMDGHNGDATSEFLSRQLPEIWNRDRYGGPVRGLKERIRQLQHLTEDNDSGSTLALAWISHQSRQAYAAVIGDSPVAIRHPHKTIWTAPEHNAATNPKERAAAIERGNGLCYYECPYLWYFDKGLQLTRAFGDKSLDPILGREPEIFRFPVAKDSVILLASDGIQDMLHIHGNPTDWNRFFGIIDVGGGAQAIVDDAVQRETRDNVTAIVCRVL